MVYGNVATSIQTVHTWFIKFRACNFNLEDEDTDVIVAMVEETPRYTVRKLADALKIPRKTIHNHLAGLGYINSSIEKPFLAQEVAKMLRGNFLFF